MTAHPRKMLLVAGAAVLAAAPVAARQQPNAESSSRQFAPYQAENGVKQDAVKVVSHPVVQGIDTPAPQYSAVQYWPLADAQGLLDAIRGIGSEGLDPSDYQPDVLRLGIAAGASPALDQQASKVFGWLVEDLRDGRTPMSARMQWHVADPDADLIPTGKVMSDALASHDIAGTLAKLDPTYPDYAALRAQLAATPPEDTDTIKLIRANMDRWRWLPHDLGGQYLLVNVPEMRLRLMVNGKMVATQRVIVGKVGRTATPQIADTVEGVIFNPTWTVPQSIIVGEGLGAKVLNNPAWARSMGYVATRDANGSLHIVQQPGPRNALGLMKLDMPNPYSIFLHDTPNRTLFERDNRALSHGCIRVDNALDLAMTITTLGKGATKDEAVAVSDSGKYTRVPLARTFPIYVGYFTMGRDVDGNMTTFKDLYKRDAPVLASFDRPRAR